MLGKRMIWLILIACLIAVGCAKDRTLVVLVPDNEGHVGTIAVTNPKGTQTLSKANQGVVVKTASAAPGAPKAVSQAEVREEFSEALAIEPSPPETFILYFGIGSATLQPASKPEIERVVETVARRESRDISVNGHSDRSGDPDYNMRLSLRRARRVRDQLVEHGVDSATITMDYHGEGNPVVETADGVPEPKNRRVEVIVR